ncbi:MAG: SAM-dependent methyltransferase [Ulvibacter sp.]|jgi:SAM-dependent methyltransferase
MYGIKLILLSIFRLNINNYLTLVSLVPNVRYSVFIILNKSHKEMNKEELNEIENQLSFPKGKNGIKLGEKMNTSNIEMTLSSINALDLKNDCTVLEIGHGSCGHLYQVLNNAKNIRYIGLEVSKTMQQEAMRINQELLKEKEAAFLLYDGQKMDFRDNRMDRIFTVNTIYFWKEPIEFLKEIYRILKSDGLFVLTFAHKFFMEQLPFVGEKFNLFSPQDIRALIKKSSFSNIQIHNYQDEVTSKSGEQVTRAYSVVVLKK